jgi:hypothetical protein
MLHSPRLVGSNSTVAVGSSIVACVGAGNSRILVAEQHHMEATCFHDLHREDPDGGT